MDALTRETVVAPPRRRGRRLVVATLMILLTLVSAAGIWFWPVATPVQKSARMGGGDVAIPVVAAEAQKRDVPIWLDGLGTVQAFQTVTVKSMVDGPLVAVGFTEGQDVQAGDVLARIDPRVYQAALDNAVARKALDQANLANARLDLARYQKLAATNYTTQQQADTQKALVAQLEAQVRQDQAQVDTAATQLSYTTIVAPLSGKVGIRLVDAGNIVHAGDATGLVVITRLQPISVVFSLPQQNLPQVAAAMASGQAVEVIAYSQGTGPKAQALDQGTLTVLDNQIDPATGTIKLKAAFPNTSGTLWPGGFVAVKLRADTARDATVVAQAAIQRGPRQSFVYVVRPDNTAARVNVTVGYEDDQGAVVTSGLQLGDKVVVDGVSRLTDGGKVSIVSPDANPASRAGTRPAAPGTRRREGSATGGGGG